MTKKKELEKQLNARVCYRTCQKGLKNDASSCKGFKNDAPPHNFFPTTDQYDDLIEEGKDKAVFIFYKEKGSLEIELIIAYPLSIIKEIIRLENEKVDSFEKYQKSCILPLISEHRFEKRLREKNENRPFYIDLGKVQSITRYCFYSEDELCGKIKKIEDF